MIKEFVLVFQLLAGGAPASPVLYAEAEREGCTDAIAKVEQVAADLSVEHEVTVSYQSTCLTMEEFEALNNGG